MLSWLFLPELRIIDSLEPNWQLLEDQGQHTTGHWMLQKGTIDCSRQPWPTPKFGPCAIQPEILWRCHVFSQAITPYEIIRRPCLVAVFHTGRSVQSSWKIQRSSVLLQEEFGTESWTTNCRNTPPRVGTWQAVFCQRLHCSDHICSDMYRTSSHLLSHSCSKFGYTETCKTILKLWINFHIHFL